MAAIIIGEYQFRSKTAATERIRSILHGVEEDVPIEGESRALLVALLDRHRSRDRKVGAGVQDVFVRPNATYGGLCFWLRRRDGTETDWSYTECLSPPGPRADFVSAARDEIRDQIDDFRVRAFGATPLGLMRCPLRGVPIDETTCHVDHVPPDTFAALLDRWVAATGIDPAAVAIVGYEDGCIGKRFQDRALADRWQRFHAGVATLRVVSRLGNLSDSRRAANALAH